MIAKKESEAISKRKMFLLKLVASSPENSLKELEKILKNFIKKCYGEI
jgi:hypothetical protein